MKKIFHLLALFISIAGIFISCNPEKSCEYCKKAPVALAGPDQIISLPTDSVYLDGSASNDPDGRISEWQWRKISGPAFFSITTSTTAKTTAKTLVTGSYQFELMVTDNDGLFAKDTVQITVSNLSPSNRPPVANAGPDQTITLPTNSVIIDGSGSTDPDNNITSYEWTKISGPSLFNISNASSIQTPVVNLDGGTYHFELKVTDLGGLFSKDTIKVAVIGQTPVPVACDNSLRPLISAQLSPVTTLPSGTGRVFITIGNKVYFLTVECINCNDSTKAKAYYSIFDLNTQTWSTSSDRMINPRKLGSIVAAGNKIYYAGGYNGIANVYSTVFSNIDIYDIMSDTWSSSSLSVGRCSLSGIVVEDKIIFAGGFSGTSFIPSDRVDIYQLSTGTWSTASLSQARGDISAVAANNKVYFAGGSAGVNAFTIGYLGASDRIDIYDNSTGTWSVSALAQEKTMMSSISVGNRIFWAGGLTAWEDWTSTVEIKDINSQSSNMTCLFQINLWQENGAIVRNNKIVFFTGSEGSYENNKFDIFDITSNSWSIGLLPVNIIRSVIFVVNNTIYVAGGLVNGVLSNQIWKLEF